MKQAKRVAWLSRQSRLIAVLSALAAAAIACIFLLGQNKAGAGTTASAYSVLSQPGPSGLTPVSSGTEANAATGPVVDAEDPQVEVASAREASVDVPGMRVWVARSKSDGICILALKPQPNHKGPVGPASGCALATLAAHGASIEQFGPSGETYVSGAVPDGVTSVAVELTDGSSKTVSVHDNVYASESTTPVQAVRFTSGGTQEQVNIGGTQ